MTDEGRTGRELTPRPEDDATITPVLEKVAGVERFSAGARAHTVGLTEERSTQIVRQSGNARTVAIVATLIVALFIPIYWFYAIGIPAFNVAGQMDKEKDAQYVSDVSRGYALFLANCARCHGDSGQGGSGAGGSPVGPPLNVQDKLYNAVKSDGSAGTGHLNPTYLNNVLTVGGRYVCGDANSLMPIWKQPGGSLSYRDVEELIAWLTASNQTSFVYDPAAAGEGATSTAPPRTVTGWRDPNYQPPANQPTPPACWRNPSGVIGGGGGSPSGSVGPVSSPGTPDSPRVIQLNETADLHITDSSGTPVAQIPVVAGETVRFEITNTAGYAHDFYVGDPTALEANDVTTLQGIAQFPSGTQDFTYTVTDATGLQFACTLPGHYSTMHGDLTIQAGGSTPSGAPGTSGSPAASGSPSASESPAPSASAAPSASVAP